MTLYTDLPPSDDFIYGYSGRYLPRNKTGLVYSSDQDNMWSLGSGFAGASASATANAYQYTIIPINLTANSNGSTGYFATANSTQSGNEPYMAFDNRYTYAPGTWGTVDNSGFPCWLKLQVPTAITVARYSITQSNESTQQGAIVKDWLFEGSTNNSTWVTLDTQTNQTGWGSTETRVFTTANTTAYPYYRLWITANNSASAPGPKTRVCELLLYSLSYYPIKFTALTPGAPGNSISLVFNGSQSVATVCGAWNTANPTNTVTYTGSGSDIMVSGTVNLTGGTINTSSALIPVTMTSNTTPAGYAASASSTLGPAYDAWKAFNASNATDTDAWLAGTLAPGWLQLGFPLPMAIGAYAITTRNVPEYTGPEDFTLSGSYDGTTWVVIDSQTGQSGWYPNEIRKFTLSTAAMFIFYRLTINTVNAGNMQIGELQFYTPSFTYESAGKWLNIYATQFIGNVLQANWADVAENFTCSEHIPPGSVVVLGGTEEISLSTKEYDTDVLGIISTDPAILMNRESEGAAVALMGQVPCLVTGCARRGDFLVSSHIPGVAKAISTEEAKLASYFCLLGRVLEDKVSEDIAFCKVLVGKP